MMNRWFWLAGMGGWIWFGWVGVSCGPVCQDTQDCKRGTYCASGACKEGCAKDADCANGQTCSSQGKCTSPTNNGTQPTSDCGLLCKKTATCFSPGSEAVCLQECNAVSAAYGATADAIIKKCNACLQKESCDKLQIGTCSAECPYELYDKQRSPANSNCAQTWAHEGKKYDITCKWLSGPQYHYDRYQCACFLDGIEKGSFESNDICQVSLAEKVKRANKGCDTEWKVPAP